ncbi:MAG: 50S ribosomal protein L25 [Myxococcota bacterium]|nr:50S ribosomal protein L25 [Myxococcota bacterium]
MGDASLAVELRTETGKGVARKLRAEGRIPAVLYGHGNPSVSLTLEAKTLERLLKASHAGLNTLIDLEGASEVSGKTVLVKELQRHPFAGTLTHADLYEIDVTSKLHVSVPIRLVGTAAGVKLGGVLEHMMREIDLLCLPSSIPDSVDVDISELEMGDTLHARDVNLPDGVETNVDEQLPVAHVALPRVEEEEEAEVGEEGEAEAGEAAEGDAPAAEGDGEAKDD